MAKYILDESEFTDILHCYRKFYALSIELFVAIKGPIENLAPEKMHELTNVITNDFAASMFVDMQEVDTTITMDKCDPRVDRN